MLKDSTAPQDILGEHGLLKPLPKRVVERGLAAALTAHLGYAPHVRPGTAEHNARNGKGQQTVQTATGPLALAGPRDRHGSLAPQRVPKRQRRVDGCDAPGRSLYARGLSPRALQGPRAQREGPEGAPPRLATRTAAVLDEGRTGQARPLAAVEPILYFDALFVTARQAGPGQTHAVSLALGIPMDGEQALPGVWLSESEGAQCWLSGFTDLSNRGGQDDCMAWVDGLTGGPEALEAVWPKPQGQLCMVQQVRHRLQ